jgi:hypothetical protein
MIALLLACTVVDAPETLEDMMVFGFEHFHDDPAYLAAMTENLVPAVDMQVDAVREGYRVNNLTPDALASAGVENADVSSILGAMGSGDYRHPLSELMVPMLAYNRAELFDNIRKFALVEEDGDRRCFQAVDCEDYAFVAEQTIEASLLGEASQVFTNEWRWIDTDAGPVLFSRTFTPDGVQFTTDLMVIHQQYGLAVIYPQPNAPAPRRVEAFWVEGEFIGIDVPAYFAVETTAKAMGQQAARLDAWVDVKSPPAE